MKKMEMPELEAVEFEMNDVIATSDECEEVCDSFMCPGYGDTTEERHVLCEGVSYDDCGWFD